MGTGSNNNGGICGGSTVYGCLGPAQQLSIACQILDSTQAPEAVPYNIPQLYSLQHLDMTVAVEDDDCLLPYAAFLKASPSLYKFVLKGSVRSVKHHLCVSSTNLSIRVLELIRLEGLIADLLSF